jgi:hypothetical protein
MHAEWRTSSFTGGDQASCVEVAWRTSSFTGGNQASCVEVAYSAVVRVRDTKNRGGGMLTLPAASWSPQHLISPRPSCGDEPA